VLGGRTAEEEKMIEASRFWNDFELTVMDEQIEFFRDYLCVIEDFLEIESKKSRERATRLYHEQYEELREQGSRFDPTEPSPPEAAWADTRAQMIDTVFASILRESFCISVYAFLESRLVEECRYRERWGTVKLPLTDVISGGIDTAKECLRGQVDFGGQEWQAIKKLQKLRNFIVHCGNSFENVKSEDVERDLKEIVAQESFLSLGSNGIIFHKGFCEKAIDSIEEFLKLL
jgi:hypothetical protein